MGTIDPGGRWGRLIQGDDWTDRYIGLPYDAATDCAALVRTVLRDRAGFDPGIPSRRAWRKGTMGTIDLAVRIAEERDDRDDWCELDGVLMRTATGIPHLGILAGRWRPWRVLHSLDPLGAQLTPLSALRAQGVTLLGVYAWDAAPSAPTSPRHASGSSARQSC